MTNLTKQEREYVRIAKAAFRLHRGDIGRDYSMAAALHRQPRMPIEEVPSWIRIFAQAEAA